MAGKKKSAQELNQMAQDVLDERAKLNTTAEKIMCKPRYGDMALVEVQRSCTRLSAEKAAARIKTFKKDLVRFEHAGVLGMVYEHPCKKCWRPMLLARKNEEGDTFQCIACKGRVTVNRPGVILFCGKRGKVCNG